MEDVEVWLARDPNGQLYAYKDKPYKYLDCWNGRGKFFCGIDIFTSIRWEDKEPTKAKITLIK